jgi:hypothetical protein
MCGHGRRAHLQPAGNLLVTGVGFPLHLGLEQLLLLLAVEMASGQVVRQRQLASLLVVGDPVHFARVLDA